MPRYFFHVRDSDELSRDTEGQELPDAEAARREAVSAAREFLSERLLHGGSLNNRSIEIADETGRVVDAVHISDALFQGGKLRSFDNDVTHSAPVMQPRKDSPE